MKPTLNDPKMNARYQRLAAKALLTLKESETLPDMGFYVEIWEIEMIQGINCGCNVRAGLRVSSGFRSS